VPLTKSTTIAPRNTAGRNMEIAAQVLGAVGLCETTIGIIYVAKNGAVFSTFEATYFGLMIGFEVAATVLFWCAAITKLLLDGHTLEPRTYVRILSKDPFNHFFIGTTSGTGEVDSVPRIAAHAFALSFIVPVIGVWPWVAYVQMIYGSQGLEYAWGICLLVACVAFTAVRIINHEELGIGDDPRGAGASFVFLFGLYTMQKTFGVCILLSDPDRLCADVIGKALVCFEVVQITEATSE